MNNVISIEKNTPHRQGMAICSCCEKVWRAVAPAETTVLECPRCYELCGEFVSDISRRMAYRNESFGCSEELTQQCIDLMKISSYVDAMDTGVL